MKDKLQTLVSRRFSIEQCRVNPKTLFVFGDNYNLRAGMGGQAIIREQVNSIGLSTKANPGAKPEDYFTDEEYEKNCKIIEEEIKRIQEYIEEKEFTAICFPMMGLGTGLSDMQRKCPKTFCYLTVKLIDTFQFNNIEFLESRKV